MTAEYDFYLTDGSPLATVFSLESNGPNSQSTPRQILDIGFTAGANYFIVNDSTLAARLPFNFLFTVINSPYAGTYHVSSATTVGLNTKIITVEPILLNSLVILGVNPATDSWIVEGVNDGQCLFYPGSSINVPVNGYPGAITNYTVVSASSSQPFTIVGITTALDLPPNTIKIAGSHVDTFFANQQIEISGNNGAGNGQYTLASGILKPYLDSGFTILTVTTAILVGTTASGIVYPVQAVTSIKVTHNSIPALATGTGLLTPPVTTSYSLVAANVLNPLIQWVFAGDHATSFQSHAIIGVTLGPSYNFIVNGDVRSVYTPGISFNVSGNVELSTNKQYVILSATFDGTNTTIGVSSIPNGTTISGIIGLGEFTPGCQLAVKSTSGISYYQQFSICGPTTNPVSPAPSFDGTNTIIYVAYVPLLAPLPIPISNWAVVYPVPVTPYGSIQYSGAISSSLELVGKGTPYYNTNISWGQALQDNQIHMLENFSNNTPPPAPLVGQLWYDTVTPALTVWNGISWASAASLGYIPLNTAGGTMFGTLNMGGNSIIGLPALQSSDPSSATSKAYVDAHAAGLNVHTATQVATTTNLTATYTNGTSDLGGGLGIGATLTNAGAFAALVIDGYAVSVSNRILVKDQTSTLQNGIYTVTVVGNGSTNWVLTRATDYNDSVTNTDVTAGNYMLVQNGAVNGSTSWIETADAIVIGTSPITFTQFAAASVYNAGTGLTLTGSTFSVTPVGTPGTYTSVTTNNLGQVTAGSNPTPPLATNALQLGGTVAASYALLVSPSFTGVPTAPTASSSTNTTQLATTAFVQTAVAPLATSAALASDVSAINASLASLASSLTTKANLNSPALTGVPTAPTASFGTNTTQLATTAFVETAVASISSGVSSFNSRTGAITLTSGDITGALGYTPYNSTNPAGYTTKATLVWSNTFTTAWNTYASVVFPYLSTNGGSYYYTVDWGYNYSYYFGRTSILSGQSGYGQSPSCWLTSSNNTEEYLQTSNGIYGSYGEYTALYFYNPSFGGTKYLRIYMYEIGGISPYTPNAGGTGTVSLYYVPSLN